MDKNILSISEAASLLGVSDETLRNWERDGKLTPFHTEGGHRRYYKTDIEKIIVKDQIKDNIPVSELEKIKDAIEKIIAFSKS
jgi:excisionase family DNA binding protein